MAIDEKTDSCGIFTEAPNNPRHQIPYDDKVADANPKALDSYRSIENNGGVGVGDLGKGEEGSRPSFEISGAFCLEIEAEAGGKAGPKNDKSSQYYSHA